MTEGALLLLHEIVDAQSLMDAFEEFIQAEFQSRIPELRAAVRDNDFPRAQQIEGELGMLEQIPALLIKRAASFKPNRV